MTERQIELVVENEINRIDRLFMENQLTQEQYDDAIKKIDKWAKSQYRRKSR